MTWWILRHDYDRVFPDVYVPRGVSLDAAGKARAAAHWAKGAAVIVGRSAAAMHGTRWLDPEAPAELARPGQTHPPAGITVFRDRLAAHECCEVDGFRVTTPARTAFDIARRLPGDQAIPILDALSAATGLHPGEIAALARTHPGLRGTRTLPHLISLIDGGAESPPESRTRLLLIGAGLPKPTTQFVIRTADGTFVARVDMAWPDCRVAVEYDGAQHWTDPAQRAKDIDRLAALHSLGWHVIRVSSTHLTHHPHRIIDQVTSALHTRGLDI